MNAHPIIEISKAIKIIIKSIYPTYLRIVKIEFRKGYIHLGNFYLNLSPYILIDSFTI
jgi:hypothetical protein